MKISTRVRAIFVAIGLVLASIVGLAPPAFADTTLCSGTSFSTCINAGYTAHGYENNYNNSYWRAESGHNCTNYVGYMLTQNGAASPGVLMGNGKDWDTSAANLGYTVNAMPAIGAIAQWDTGTYGHVAYVESIGPNSITVSEDNASPYNTFAWRTITTGGNWPSHFLHIKDVAGSGPSSSITGDNKADLIWYEAWNNNGQAKVIGTNSSGNGTAFGNAWFSGYAAPTWAGLGDFNGDGKTDLAWYESWNNGTLKVLFSNGSGFSSSVTWFSGFSAPKWADVGDFTGDGKDDIAWYEDWNNGGTLKVIPTNSSGNGPNTSITWFSGFSAPDWADVGDLTGDGKDDIAWYEGWNNGSLKVIVTNSSGNGTASGNVWFSGYGSPTWAAIGDFSGDSKKDIAWYEDWNSGGKLSILPSNGSGVNSSISWFTGFAKPTRAFAADFNGDGRDDIGWYEASQENGRLKVIPTKSDGTGTQPTITWFTGYAAPTWAAAG